MNRLFGPALLAAVFLPATACMHGQAGSPDGGVTSGDPAPRCAALASAMQRFDFDAAQAALRGDHKP